MNDQLPLATAVCMLIVCSHDHGIALNVFDILTRSHGNNNDDWKLSSKCGYFYFYIFMTFHQLCPFVLRLLIKLGKHAKKLKNGDKADYRITDHCKLPATLYVFLKLDRGG